MAKFVDLAHADLGRKRVKIGFSWTAFFFTVFWFGVNRLWRLFWVWLLFLACGAVTIAFANNPDTDRSLVPYLNIIALLLNWTFHLVPGFNGNRWQRENLERQGFVEVTGARVAEPPGFNTTPTTHQVSVLDGSDRAPCPFCAEDIKKRAVLCRFCGSSLEPGWSGQSEVQCTADVQTQSRVSSRGSVSDSAIGESVQETQTGAVEKFDSTTENTAASSECHTPTAEMERYGITFDGEFYRFSRYRYEKLEEAIAYARIVAGGGIA